MMTRTANKLRKTAICCAAALMAGTLVAAECLPIWERPAEAEASPEQTVTRYEGEIYNDLTAKYNSEVVKAIPEEIDPASEISVIVKSTDETMLSAYEAQSGVSRFTSVAEYAGSSAGRQVARNVKSANSAAAKRLEASGVKFSYGTSYDTVFGGFEVLVAARDFDRLAAALDGTDASAMVGEVWEREETVVVENDVNVHETGIFDSSDSEYDGSGTLIAVLDTGLDYTHTAFDVNRFTSDTLALTYEDVNAKLRSLRAAQTTSGLTAGDVFISNKVPYGYDYADKDNDVYPLQDGHGTHVSGIIAGVDDVITGVAPNAQLASMKVFSDSDAGARQSWILAALEDCVMLDVDVINMSLGSACGYSVEADEEQQAVFNSLLEHGISLVAAASNDYNSTFGSEKNGSLGLTTNPDSATVGSPSTYYSALSVASISGVKTPYLLYGDEIIYFHESTNSAAEPKNFVEDLLPDGVEGQTYEYVRIPGVGRSADYTDLDVTGKIALVKRGVTNFEDKARIAANKGAAGVIIYNNVSGDISMSVGRATIAVCSISQDDGEHLAEQASGKITISRSQTAGPFMSDFSSWGPTPDLRIKPEITAHGGDILSSVPGQAYDRISGTSMACPNQAGVTALVRQYVKEKFSLTADDGETRRLVTALVNRIMMSTADIADNTNGLPFSVRKQGAGLANLKKATSSPAYITTYDRDTGAEMDKAKIELGDDRDKTGVYQLKFTVNNVFGGALSYDVSAVVMTEGVSKTKTHQGATTVTQEGYLLSPAVEVTSVEGGTQAGSVVSVPEGGAATVTLTITLSDEDKRYLNDSFANGMYVEGFVKLAPTSGTDVSLNVPYLAFYGDWTQAPIFDLDYFETNPDELDDGIDPLDKTMPDAYATRPIGGVSGDLISYLGSYLFKQNSSDTQVAAQREHIALSNSTNAVNSIYAVYAGLLRGAKRVEISITDATTGELVFTHTELNQRKSYTYGADIAPSTIDVHFSAADYDLKNNTQYLVKVEAYLDYGDGGKDANLRNTFEFPFVTDFLSPVVTDVEFYTEYDRDAEKNRLYARAYVYDNHYAMAMDFGQVYYGPLSDGTTGPVMHSFLEYPVPIVSEFGATTPVTVELTDYVDRLADSYHPDTFTLMVYDYAQNVGAFEIRIPEDVKYLYFDETDLTLSPNELHTVGAHVFPATEWAESLEYVSDDPSVARVVGGKVLAVQAGETTITARSADGEVSASFHVKVLAEGEEGYVRYDKPVVEYFRLAGYEGVKVFYFIDNDDRDIGLEGYETKFSPSATSYNLSMYPSEAVQLEYELSAYFPDSTRVEFTSGNENIVRVDENGLVTAVAEGTGTVSVRVLMDDKSTLYDRTIVITVKNPYVTNGPYLMGYYGNGGVVEIPEDLGVTQISQYAFSNYDYVPKDENDIIDEEDPYYSKPVYLGEDTITEVVLPEGIEVINMYAFAGLTSLTKVTLPSTCKNLGTAAFYGCTSLREVVGLEHVQFINERAFSGPAVQAPGGGVVYDAAPLPTPDFGSVVSIGNYAFRGSGVMSVSLPATAQSIGLSAFAECRNLYDVRIGASRVRLGANAFYGDSALQQISVNAYNIPEGVFLGCSELKTVTLGPDVMSVGAHAFYGTKVQSFRVSANNTAFKTGGDGAYLLSADGATLALVAPAYSSSAFTLSGVNHIGDSAFASNSTITQVTMPDVKTVGEYAFSGCEQLRSVSFGALEEIGESAFAYTRLSAMPALADTLKVIPAHAFEYTLLKEVTLGDGVTVEDYAFAGCVQLMNVTLGENVTVGGYAFAAPTRLSTRQITTGSYSGAYIVTSVADTSLVGVTIGSGARLGAYAFGNNTRLASLTLGDGAQVGSRAFYNCTALPGVDLSKTVSLGNGAFAGELIPALYIEDGEVIETLGIYGSQAPGLTSADLSSVTALGEGVFYGNFSLRNVTLGEAIEEIPTDTFYLCQSLTSVDLSKVHAIGEFAFMGTGLSSVDLSSVDNVGTMAFAASSYLASVTLKEGASIGENAFRDCVVLSSAEGIGKTASIGASAFEGTRLSGALDLSGVRFLGDFAFRGTRLTEVTLGDGLEDVGDNPFAGCRLPAFVRVEDELFNGIKVGETELDTFDLAGNVKVIGGVLYRAVPTGLELITYPAASENAKFSVQDGTVRIGAEAFEEADSLSMIDMPVSLRAIGDKAFFGCDGLSIVTFRSLHAPILEEQYDEAYADDYGNWPIGFIGTLSSGEEVYGLGIFKFDIWGVDQTVFFYGANFKNYIGHGTSDMVMVAPKNGVGYDSYIYSFYFHSILEGAPAPEQATLDAIAAIDALPDTVSLEDEAQIAEARRLYNLIASLEQQALVTNYSRLTSAENRLAFLKGEEKPAEPEEPAEETSPERVWIIVLAVTSGVLLAAVAVLATLLALKRRAPHAPEEGEESEEGEAPEAQEGEVTEAPEVPAEAPAQAEEAGGETEVPQEKE